MEIFKPKIKIAISGAAETGHCNPQAMELSMKLGEELVKHDCIVVTGATTGAPYWVAKAAKQAGGIVIGLSPAISEQEHIKKYRLPIDYHDLIIYTGSGYAGRNLLLTRAADAVITICGRMGTLNEFTIAFEENKLVGVLEGTGGIADMLKEIIEQTHRGPGEVIFNSDPKQLVEQLIEIIKQEKEQEYFRIFHFC
jgi:uncharacterized protein (TIGR00725 family)